MNWEYDDELDYCPGPHRKPDDIRKPEVHKDPVTYRMSYGELRRVMGIAESGQPVISFDTETSMLVVKVIP